MRTTLNLTLLAFLFFQTSFGQIINYESVALIVIGEYHTEEDIQIIKEEVESNNKQNTVIKLLKTDRYLNKTVNINGNEIPKSCSDFYIAREKDNDLIKELKEEVLQLKKKYETTSASDNQITELNKKTNKFNLLIQEQNVAIDNFRMCAITHREIEKDYDKITEDLYMAYKAALKVKEARIAQQAKEAENTENTENTEKVKKPITIADND